ncbi:alpha/beta hydrolase [Paraburkholderia sp. Ac-20340]|uniref:alpha/beta hydrolase n=1 Tax=Paraburkholderia sp. Ac-20340 TaxID=2703888 RepID=UPI0019826C5D|nr:alpha/beta hydrolase [Paraburkholderia sp. Ac-20340]MBN3853315.1 alpha/beta hydrolase [Paraburkholderia sp. Ac-20340]
MKIRLASLAAGAAVAASSVMWAALHPVVLLNAMVPRTDYNRFIGMPYGQDARQRIDVYQPRADRSGSIQNAHRAIVVFFYGGSWQGGNRKDYRFVGEALASRGFVVAIPDYRVYPQVVFPGFMHDAAEAVRWASDHAAMYGADPARIFLMGHSAGAQIALLLATDRSWLAQAGVSPRALAGAIGLAGPYDFLPLTDPTLMRVFPLTVRAASQPISFIEGGEPPVFLAAGLRDTSVDPANTARMARKLREQGDLVEVHEYATLSHEMTIGMLAAPLRALAPVIPIAPILDDITAFIHRHPFR